MTTIGKYNLLNALLKKGFGFKSHMLLIVMLIWEVLGRCLGKPWGVPWKGVTCEALGKLLKVLRNP